MQQQNSILAYRSCNPSFTQRIDILKKLNLVGDIVSRSPGGFDLLTRAFEAKGTLEDFYPPVPITAVLNSNVLTATYFTGSVLTRQRHVLLFFVQLEYHRH